MARGGWDVLEFFDTGDAEMDRVMARAQAFGHPTASRLALDFGCGVGRVTRPMSRYFDVAVGVDISTRMIESARLLNEAYPTCRFETTGGHDLAQFADGEFDLVYSSIVLQHVPGRSAIEGYVREFVRILRPGGLLAFQLPSAIPLRYRLQPRRRAYSVLRTLGTPPSFLRGRLGLHPIRMSGIPESRIRQILGSEQVRILEVDHAIIDGFGIDSCTYWVTRA